MESKKQRPLDQGAMQARFWFAHHQFVLNFWTACQFSLSAPSHPSANEFGLKLKKIAVMSLGVTHTQLEIHACNMVHENAHCVILMLNLIIWCCVV